VHVIYFLLACGLEEHNYDLIADSDRDGFNIEDGDCDDLNPYIYPQSDEICDSLDNNCDGLIDLDLDIYPSYFVDSDGDGFGNVLEEVEDCELPLGYSFEGGDCDDSNSNIYPDAEINWEDAFFDMDCDQHVQPYLKTPQSTWGAYDQKSLLVIPDSIQNSENTTIQPILISGQSIHFLDFPSGQSSMSHFQGVELTSHAIGTQNGNIAVFAQEVLGEDQGILLYDIEEMRQNAEAMTSYWQGSIGFLSLPGFEVTDLKDVGDFLGIGNILGVAAQTNDFHYMLFYEELGDLLLEEPQGWSQSMEWDQGNVVISQNDISMLGENIWGVGDINNDGYDDIAIEMLGSDVLHIIKGSFAPRMSYPYWTLQSELGCQVKVTPSERGEAIIFCLQDDQTFVFGDYQYGGSADMMSAELHFSKQIDDMFYIEHENNLSYDYFAIVSDEQLLFHQKQSGKFQDLQRVGYSFSSPITSEIFPISNLREDSNDANPTDQISLILATSNSIFWLDSPPLH
jgi:hypothetical protein